MFIITSEIIARNPQVDGRVYVTELHVDYVGREYRIEYLTSESVGVQEAIMAARASQLENESILAELDFYETLVLDGVPILPDHPPKYTNVEMIYGYLFNKFCAETDPVKLLKASTFTDLFSDEELASYGLTVEQILSIRTEAEKIKSAKVLLDGYLPPLGGE